MDKDLKNKTREELFLCAADHQQKPYIADYIFSFIHDRNVHDINGLTTLSKAFRSRLIQDGYFISQGKVIDIFADPDGTAKYLIEYSDGTRIESVLMTDHQRQTLCISSQAGCRMGCRFCATGKIGFKRNLTAGEIVDQVNLISAESGRIHNLVYMGMGEPFDNIEEVIRSIRIVRDEKGRHIGQRHITVSTCGLPEGIRIFADQQLQVRLAVSLHSTEETIRKQLIPAARKYPLSELRSALQYYLEKTERRITVEYCLIRDLNDSQQQAAHLADWLSGLNVNVNLIEYNSHPGCHYEASPKEQIVSFATILKSRHIETVIRYKRGCSIKAACGQLGADLLKTE